MWLEFISPNGVKWYAQTPGGEYAWADCQGLYEWRHDGRRLQRIDYTGADRQCSTPGGMWSTGAGAREDIMDNPKTRGFREALRGYRGPTN